ncbi:PhoH family protein [Entomobacter blattae]|nr:PhoH family protein [Entomobacter blattae]
MPLSVPLSPDTPPPIILVFENNPSLALLVGQHDQHLALIEQSLGVRLSCRGSQIVIRGNVENSHLAQQVLESLYSNLNAGQPIDADIIASTIRMVAPKAKQAKQKARPLSEGEESSDRLSSDNLPEIKTKKGNILPRSPGQAQYMHHLAHQKMVFGVGPAGTGKTFLAVAQAVAMLHAGLVDRIILSRPAVEAGERLGFLPGDMKEKIDPYLRPLYDALHIMMPAEQINKRMVSGEIEVAPLAFMRGRTLAHAYVILDEAQNTTSAQMKMFLTRMGSGTHMVITGDLSQVDLPAGTVSGLKDAIETLHNIEGIATMRFTSADVVRHPLVARIVDAYDKKKTGHTRNVKKISPS